ncbi:MAG: hypothetical protein Q9164_007897, partial [Protoblastenia rupestris]
ENRHSIVVVNGNYNSHRTAYSHNNIEPLQCYMGKNKEKMDDIIHEALHAAVVQHMQGGEEGDHDGGDDYGDGGDYNGGDSCDGEGDEEREEERGTEGRES